MSADKAQEKALAASACRRQKDMEARQKAWRYRKKEHDTIRTAP